MPRRRLPRPLTRFVEVNDMLRNELLVSGTGCCIFQTERELLRSLLDLYETRPAGYHHVESRCSYIEPEFGKEVSELHSRLRIIKVTLADKKLKLQRIVNEDIHGGTGTNAAAASSRLEWRIGTLREERKQLKWCLDMARTVVAKWQNGIAVSYVDDLKYAFTHNVFANKYEIRLQERHRQEMERVLQEKKLDENQNVFGTSVNNIV